MPNFLLGCWRAALGSCSELSPSLGRGALLLTSSLLLTVMMLQDVSAILESVEQVREKGGKEGLRKGMKERRTFITSQRTQTKPLSFIFLGVLHLFVPIR